MKKTNIFQVTIIAVLALLFGSGGGIAWGQAYKKGYVTDKQRSGLRRGDANNLNSRGYIGNAQNVNNEFGAGESAIVNSGDVTFPTPQHGLNTNPTALRVGSEYSQNATINIYDNGGNAAGRIVNVHFKNYRKAAWPTTWGSAEGDMINSASEDRMFFPSLEYNASTDVGNLALFTGGSGSAAPPTPAGAARLGIAQIPSGVPYFGSVFSAVKTSPTEAVFPIHNHVAGWDKTHFTIKISSMTDLVYTSLVNSTTNIDDGKILHYVIPTDESNYGNYHNLVPTANNGPVTATSYVRPTTVMVEGTGNTFDLLRMSNIGWWVMPMHGTIDLASTENHGGHIFNEGGCTHFSGYVYYQTQKASFVAQGAYQIPGAYVNGAIRFLGDSYTCVKGNAENAAEDTKTKAFLVVPNNKHYGLRVGGNFDKFKWHVETSAAENNTGMYSASGAPAFPSTDVADIYLQKGSSSAWGSEKNWGTLTTNHANNISAHLASYDVKGGIFGVNGMYANANAIIHTAESSSALTGNNHAVIEVGAATNASYDKFKVYSGGTFKNFRSTCVSPIPCQAINMATTSPVLTINDTEPLNILNDGGTDGSTCCANILLAGAGATAISTALSGSQTGTGALHVQALGEISATGNITMDASSKNNNVAFISEGSKISLAGLEYKGGTGAGAGYDANLTVWAQGDTTTGACGGHIDATGDVKVTSQQTTNSFQNLITYVPDYSSNLRYDLYCDDQRTTVAAAHTNLTTPLQTRIQSDRDYVRVQGDFKYEGVKGALLVQGARAVTFDKKAEIKFTNEGDAAIQSRHSTVTVGQDFNYESTHTANDLFVDGFGGVYFNGGGKIDMAAATGSNVALQSNAGDVSFSGASGKRFDVKFTTGNTGDLDIMAGRDVLFNIPFTSTENNSTIPSRVFAGRDILSNGASSDVSFLSTSDNGSTLTWVARRNITTNGILTAAYTGANTGIMGFQAAGGNITANNKVRISTENTNNVLFSAEMLGCGVQNTGNTPYTDCTPGNRNRQDGNIYWNDSVTIKRSVTTHHTTNILAMNNIRTQQVGIMNAADEDTTNVISYKGDIWLGYSGAPSVNNHRFTYTGSGNGGQLNIKAGYQDQINTNHDGGGNIYFTSLRGLLKPTGEHKTEVSIPFSNEYICGSSCDDMLHNRAGNSLMRYEHSGIIGGLGPCHKDKDISNYSSIAQGGASMTMGNTDTSLVYLGNKGDLTLDAGRRGNIILNKGAKLDYDSGKGNAIFRTREGDIDMRDPFDAERMNGNLLFLAQLENLGDLSKIGVCGCDEERNNVYLQDFKLRAGGDNGSVFIGADNNIKLNYGGLTNIGTRQDPFLSQAYEEKDGRVLKLGRGYKFGGGCDRFFHCDLDGNENQARPLTLDFQTANSGGFAAVASDMIDVYKDLIYNGGNGTGMGSVPGTGTLHGESVSGYGLFMKTQGNKKNWTANVFRNIPKCPTDCAPTGCGGDGKEATGFLHNTVRMTFHSDARFRAENQRVHLESPVIETFGVLELNTLTNGGSNAQITVKTDSLICHDSMVIIGSSKVKLSSWSGLPNDQPIIKLGYSRKAAPFEEWAEENKRCRECVSHYKGKVYAKGETPLDTMFVKFGPTTELRRQNVMVIDHTVLSFLTDSFDHVKGGEVLNARYFVDTLKIRNQVEFWTDKMHERDGHLELISEQQMLSKDYAGMYTRHLHLEPIGACGRPSSELWLPGLALDVITYSTFGGFGIQYTDVHVENQANLNPGFTSLRLRGQCFEQRCGTLTMKDLRLDGGANLNFSVGTRKGLNGEYSDAIDVDKLTTYGSVNVNLEIRPCERIEKRCYPIIYYKSVSPNSLNALKLNPSTIKIDGDEYPLHLDISKEGVVYVCVGDAQAPTLSHTVTMPETSGVKTTPGKGIWSVPARGNFRFSATYSGQKPLVVRTNRMFNGQQEVLAGILNSNGEYEYIVPGISQEVTLTFGPDAVANELLKGTAVWSHGEMIYIRVDRADIASIYSVAGQLVKRVDLPEGDTSIPMSRGAYVITLKDGSVHKVIVK